MRNWNKAVGLLLLPAVSLIVSARQDPPPATNSQPKQASGSQHVESSMTVPTNNSVHVVEPGIFEVGRVRLDQRRRSVTLPATLNKSQGLMEYFLVTTYGKTHESILKSQAEPYHIHLAMLLLGAHGPGNADFPGSPANGVPGPVVHPSKETIPGDKIAIEVKWKTTGGETRRSAEDLIRKNYTPTNKAHGWWVYNGSLIVNNKFLAQMDGSIISLVTDPVALINYTAPGHDNDLIWEPNPTNLPPPDLPVEVTISFMGAPPQP